MPAIITPEMGHSGGDSGYLAPRNVDLGYTYPADLDLRPDTDLHRRLVARILQAADEAYTWISSRFDAWNLIDETVTAYIPLADYERNLKLRKDQGVSSKTKPISIVIPNTFAVEDTLLTYLSKVFLMQPIFQYEGIGPEDEIGAKLLEVLVNQQVQYTRAALDLHAAFRSGLRYGISASTMEWTVQRGLRSKAVTRNNVSLTGEVLNTTVEKETVETVLFEGNDLSNIDPYRMLPDPNISAHKARNGAYFGWTEIEDYESLLSKELYDPELFNVKYLKTGVGYQRTSRFTSDLSAREKFYTGTTGSAGIKTNVSTRKITKVNMYMTVIPKELGLGTSENPEVWFFRLGDDQIVLTAMPLGLHHGEFPIAINAPEYDGFTMTPVSRLEVVHGLQEISNWAVNSHMANVRKAINDMFVVDPSLIYMPDFKKPGAGRLLRLRREAWGRGTENAVTQLPVNDITRNHTADSSFFNDLMQRASGAVDPVQGIMRSGGERRSATEARGSLQGAMSRLEHNAYITSLMYMQPLARFYASHTQQLMTEERKLRVLGSWPQVLRDVYGRSVSIKPTDILVDSDILVKDGTTPTAGSANAEVLVTLFQIMNRNPTVAAKFDVVRFFMDIALILGMKNVQDFAAKGPGIQATVRPDAEVAAGAQQGNLIPLAQAARG